MGSDPLHSPCSNQHSLKWTAALHSGADTPASCNGTVATGAARSPRQIGQAVGIRPGTPSHREAWPPAQNPKHNSHVDHYLWHHKKTFQTSNENIVKPSLFPPSPAVFCAHQTEMNYKWKGAQSEQIDTNKVWVSHDTVLSFFLFLLHIFLPLLGLTASLRRREQNNRSYNEGWNSQANKAELAAFTAIIMKLLKNIYSYSWETGKWMRLYSFLTPLIDPPLHPASAPSPLHWQADQGNWLWRSNGACRRAPCFTPLSPSSSQCGWWYRNLKGGGGGEVLPWWDSAGTRSRLFPTQTFLFTSVTPGRQRSVLHSLSPPPSLSLFCFVKTLSLCRTPGQQEPLHAHLLGGHGVLLHQ